MSGSVLRQYIGGQWVPVAAGARGYTGSAGEGGGGTGVGYTGSQGIQGYTGSQGIQGYTGSQGLPGIDGAQGPQGYTGSQGLPGIDGAQGPQGVTGYTGSQGLQGVIGYTGSASTVAGPIGYTGSAGPQGIQGPIGYTGSAGTGGGASALDDLTDVTITSAATGQILSFDGSVWINSNNTGAIHIGSTPPADTSILWVSDEEGADIIGLPINGNTNQILKKSSENPYDVTWTSTLSNVSLVNYNEGAPYALTQTSGTISVDVANGNVQLLTVTGNITINKFVNPIAGQSVTIVITQDATGNHTLSSTMKFAGGTKTLSTDANSIDILSIYYDGSRYLASLSTGFD